MSHDEGASALRATEVSVGTWGRDLVVGWSAPWGPSLARIVRGSSGDREDGDLSALVLGARGAARQPPQLVTLGERLACAWIDVDGGSAAVLEEPHDHVGSTPVTVLALRGAKGAHALEIGKRSSLGGDARALAVAAGEAGPAWIAVASASGVRLATLRDDGTVSWDPTPWIARQAGVPRLALAEVRGQPILCALYPNERELLVVRREGERPVLVTHRLEQPVVELAVQAAGSRLAVGLLESSGARVSCAFVDARGKLTERPVALIDRYAGEHAIARIDGLGVVWAEDGFRLIARDAERRQAYVLPFLDGERDAERVGVVPRVPGPPSARYSVQRLEIVAAEHDDDEGRLLVARTKIDGTEAAPVELRLAPPFEVARERAQTRAHGCCVEVARTIAGASYRDATLVAESTEEGARLELPSTAQQLEVSFEDDRAIVVTLSTRGEQEPLEVDQSSFGRLARWVRHRLSHRERTLAALEEAWARRVAEELAEGARIVDAEVRASSPTGAILEVVLTKVPRADVLARWIAHVREELAAGKHRASP
ncbi:MAG: hypothetical protein K1X94_08920 [Sandaracinaceae bacterium]|nr:hypothetical protein [Sandaracinaceae bacterium]